MAIFNPRTLLSRSSNMLRLQPARITTTTPRVATALNQTTTLRQFSQTPLSLARKDAQDKDSLKPEPNEYSKSGSDDAAAAVEDAAFDPSKTKPEEAHASAEKESGNVRQPTPLLLFRHSSIIRSFVSSSFFSSTFSALPHFSSLIWITNSKTQIQDSNPLDVSPANQEVSKARDPQEGGHEGSSAESGQGPSDRARTSGGGSPDKGAKGQKYSS